MSVFVLTLHQIIASSCRQKIILTLSKVNETHVTNLVRMMNSTYNQVQRNLQILEREGIVTITPYGYLKMVRLRTESSKTRSLLKALHQLENDTYTAASNHEPKQTEL